MKSKRSADWKIYEDVAKTILNNLASEFKLSNVEGKQLVDGIQSGTKWEIDAKGILENGSGFLVIECRRNTTSKQSQDKIGSLAYKIIDTAAVGGIMISAIGVQKGGQLVANAAKIIHMQLDKESTPLDYCLQFLNRIFIGHTESVNATDSMSTKTIKKCKGCNNFFELHGCEAKCPLCLK